MKKLRHSITAIVMVVAVAAVAIAAFWAVKQTQDNIALFRDTQSQSGCANLDSRAAVEKEMTDKADLIGQIKALGEGVRVRMSLPCEGENKAEIEIYVNTKDDKAAVEKLIKQQPFKVQYEIKII